MRAPSIDAHLAQLDSGAAIAETDRNLASLVRGYLDESREYLRTLQETTGSGRAVNEANSDLTDRLVRRLFSLAEDNLLADGGQIETGLCVVAVGGYARREMSIFSDVDLLILYRDQLSPYVTSIAERLQYWLWDAGLRVGCATRTVDETVSLGREDVTVRTAVLMARYLCGDGEFFHVFADVIRRELLPDPAAFMLEQREAMKERHQSYGESLFLLQPNLKEGAGGLRDYHTAYWVARAGNPSFRDLDDMLHFGLLTEAEMSEFRDALEFLWSVRNQLHLTVGRCNDQMSFELQEQVCEALGYGKSDDDAPDLPVERFMGEYYKHARAIQGYSELVIDQCHARADGAPRTRQVRDVEEGFRVTADHLEIPHAAHLRERPLRLLLVFEVAQKHDVPLSRMARRLIRENLDLMDEALQCNPDAAATFLRILGAERRVMRTLMAMNETGLLGAFLPEWQHIVYRWQHVLYHTYTVDVHSIFLVEELRRLWQGKYEQGLPELTELMQSVEDRATLFLGCLLHDIGKGLGGDHSNKGAVRARTCVERLGLSPERVERVIFIVEFHLRMSHIAQRRDLSDPKLILEFAKLCGDRENLRNLYLATFADIRASSRDAWTPWKGNLLRELFARSAEFLETGADNADRAIELIEARVDLRQEGARRELHGLGVSDADILAYFDGMPRRYFIGHTPKQIARHAQVMLRYRPDRTFATAFREMRGGFTEFILVTRDVHGLYGTVAGTLTGCQVNILGSNVYTNSAGIALEVYRLSTPAGGREEIDLTWREFEGALERVLAGEIDVSSLHGRRFRPIGKVKLQGRKAPSVLISNSESDFYTIVDVTANDRIGLLYDLTRTIGEHDLEIYISKAATIQDQVADTFYLKDREGKKVRDPERIAALQAALVDIVEQGENGEGEGGPNA